MRNLRAASCFVLVVSLLAAVPKFLRADLITTQDFNFNLGDSAIQGVTGAASGTPFLTNPYATLTISADATTGEVDFTVSPTADNSSVAINALFTEFSFNTNLKLGTDFSLLFAPGSDSPVNLTGNPSGFGDFSYTIGDHTVLGQQSYAFGLMVADPSQATIDNFVLPNVDGNVFAAYMSASVAEGPTAGYIAVNGANPALSSPAPSTMVMSSILFGLFGGVWSYRQLKAATAER